MELQLHTLARLLRQEGAYSRAIVARHSFLAGSRHVNNLARSVVYGVMEEHGYRVPPAVPRTWFDDVSVRATGSKTSVVNLLYFKYKLFEKDFSAAWGRCGGGSQLHRGTAAGRIAGGKL